MGARSPEDDQARRDYYAQQERIRQGEQALDRYVARKRQEVRNNPSARLPWSGFGEWLEEQIQAAKIDLRQVAETGSAEQLDERLEQLCQQDSLRPSTYAQGVLRLFVRQLKEQKAAGGSPSGAP